MSSTSRPTPTSSRPSATSRPTRRPCRPRRLATPSRCRRLRARLFAVAPAYGVPMALGPAGQVRSTGTCVPLTIVTLGFYTWYWFYKTHDEMKRHTGDGLGGGIALLLTIFVGIVMATGANVNILRVEGAGRRGSTTCGHSGTRMGSGRAAEECRPGRADRRELYRLRGRCVARPSKGTDCAIVMMENVALSRTFGEEAGRWFHGAAGVEGVEIHGGEDPPVLRGGRGRQGRWSWRAAR